MDPNEALHQMRLKAAYLRADYFARLLYKQTLSKDGLKNSEELQRKLSDAIDEVIRLEQGRADFTQCRSD
jgi:hypothetical protein